MYMKCECVLCISVCQLYVCLINCVCVLVCAIVSMYYAYVFMCAVS